ncbi:hypothetical protein Pyn_04808 [Prunus yedoensis var. nudiflora]|uniref:Uncharacterized protein n=1 Tax=Prunus yedoensis var. nudiflora TaxID=2094558 RepID=A0A314UJ15_PRUYE|nr:hypothetical protein Pyn_04808 [Prunus yedoensis var. nudiflora]
MSFKQIEELVFLQHHHSTSCYHNTIAQNHALKISRSALNAKIKEMLNSQNSKATCQARQIHKVIRWGEFLIEN